MANIFRIFLTIICIHTYAHAGNITKNHTFVRGTTISSSQINSNFDQLIAELNSKETRITTLEGLGGGGPWSLSGSDAYYNAGNVGIGTASPTRNLEISAAGDGFYGMKITRSAAPTRILEIGQNGIGAAGGAYMQASAEDITINPAYRLYMTAGGGAWGNGFIFAPNSSYDGTNNQISFQQTGTWAPTAGANSFIGTNLNPTINQTAAATGPYTGLLINVTETSYLGTDGRLFDVQKNNNSMFMVKSNGNVGIGTVTPNFKLDIAGSTGTSGLIHTTTSGTTGADFAGIRIMSPNSLLAGGQLYIDGTSNSHVVLANSENGDLAFATNNTEQMRILSGGNVGLGDINPDTKLKVVGAICAKSNDADCAGNVAGTVYANNTTVQNADYAEYFLSDEILNKGDVVGLNLNSGLARGYRSGDKLLGIISTNPGVVGNADMHNKKSVLVALIGQVPFNKKQVVIKNNTLHTFDGKQIGYLLADGKVYLNISSTDQLREINELKLEIKDLKKLVSEMVKHHEK